VRQPRSPRRSDFLAQETALAPISLAARKLSEFILSLPFQSSLLGPPRGIFISFVRYCPVGSRAWIHRAFFSSSGDTVLRPVILPVGSGIHFDFVFCSSSSPSSVQRQEVAPVSRVFGCFQFLLCGGCSFINFDFSIDCELLQGKASITLELSDQKARGFLLPIVLKGLFPEHVHKMFGEIPVRT
jgi:hypothetical protein